MTIARDGLVVASLAAADYRHEGRMSLCLIVALAAVLAPLLVLFGLRYGIVSSLGEELRSNPSALQLTPTSQDRHGEAFFAALASRPETAFLVPNTRFLPSEMTLRNPAQPSIEGLAVRIVPTAAGDPLLQTTAVRTLGIGKGEVALSQSAAEKLKVGADNTVIGRLGRVVKDRSEPLYLPFRIRAVIPVAAEARDAAFVPSTVLYMAEDYREGYAVPEWQASGLERPLGERLFASFRLYARSIYDVAPLREWLAAQGIDTETQLSKIQFFQRLDHALTLLFLIVAGLGGLGFGISLTISLWANVERKRYELAVLQLLGLPSLSLGVFPIVQAMLTAAAGSALAGLLYALAEPLINRLFAEGPTATQVICRMPLSAFLVAAVLTFALAVVAAAAAGWRATSFSPARGLRHE